MSVEAKTTSGTIVRVIANRGFGFLKPDGSGNTLFFHINDTAPELGEVMDDSWRERRVTFETAEADRGFRAINVQSE